MTLERNSKKSFSHKPQQVLGPDRTRRCPFYLASLSLLGSLICVLLYYTLSTENIGEKCLGGGIGYLAATTLCPPKKATYPNTLSNRSCVGGGF